MYPSPVIGCTLSADGISDRLAWIRDEIVPHAVDTVRLERGLAFELAPAPGLAEKLDRLVRLERECCSHIVFERVASATPGRLRLEVRGIDPDAPVFHALRVPSARAPVRARRLAKAAGVGAIASLVVCCGLPVAAAALLGASAAPLAGLESPGALAASAVAAGVATWWWLGRRRATREGRRPSRRGSR